MEQGLGLQKMSIRREDRKITKERKVIDWTEAVSSEKDFKTRKHKWQHLTPQTMVVAITVIIVPCLPPFLPSTSFHFFFCFFSFTNSHLYFYVFSCLYRLPHLAFHLLSSKSPLSLIKVSLPLPISLTLDTSSLYYSLLYYPPQPLIFTSALLQEIRQHFQNGFVSC